MEMPECPVCLQAYDGEEVIPRVLPCGHSACSPCIAQLASSPAARPFPDAIRCPACNQVVRCPRDRGPDALPKNIDLLRLCSPPSSSSSSCCPVQSEPPPERRPVELFPIPWDEQLFSTWKDWVLPFDSISTTEVAATGTEAVPATLTRTYYGGHLEERVSVRLLAVGDPSSLISTSIGCEQFKLSYTARVMEALSKLAEKERVELRLIMAASSRERRGLCPVFGLWMSPLENSPLFLVCERYQFDLSCASVELEEHQNGLINVDEMFGFARIAMELCEVVIGLQSQGVVCGCLAPSCFCFDGYGHCLLDLNEVLLVGRRVRKDVAEARRRNSRCSLGKLRRFASPELLTSLQSDHTSSDFGNGVGYESDVWSLGFILVVLLVGDGQLTTALSEGTTDDDCDELNLDVYNTWRKKVASILKASSLSTKLESLLLILDSCLDYNPASRPCVNDVWRCIMSSFIKPHCIVTSGSDIPVAKRDLLCCLVLGDLCCLPEDENHQLIQQRNVLEGTENILEDHSSSASMGSGGRDAGCIQQEKADQELLKGFHGSGLKSGSLQGHQDCITGLAVGGGFLFSSSFDKTIHVWSLEDFALVQTLRGHEHRIMAVVVVDAARPSCITGDSGGCIYAWGIGSSVEKEPLRKWHDHNDWRYSGVHSLAVSGSQYLYSGSGDKSIKAWSLQDYSLTCTMTGHKSVVSSLRVSDGILYSGSWDGTIRLWWLHDHSPLMVLEDDKLLNGSSVLSLSLHGHLLVASYDNGILKMWRNDVLLKSVQVQNGALFAVEMNGKWLFTGGWDKIIQVQELSENESHVELRPVGTISCDSVVTSLLHWQGKLFVGSNKDIKVYYSIDTGYRSTALTT